MRTLVQILVLSLLLAGPAFGQITVNPDSGVVAVKYDTTFTQALSDTGRTVNIAVNNIARIDSVKLWIADSVATHDQITEIIGAVDSLAAKVDTSDVLDDAHVSNAITASAYLLLTAVGDSIAAHLLDSLYAANIQNLSDSLLAHDALYDAITEIAGALDSLATKFTIVAAVDSFGTFLKRSAARDSANAAIAAMDSTKITDGKIGIVDVANLQTNLDARLRATIAAESLATFQKRAALRDSANAAILVMDSTGITNDKIGFEDVNNLPEALATKISSTAAAESLATFLKRSAARDSAYAALLAADSTRITDGKLGVGDIANLQTDLDARMRTLAAEESLATFQKRSAMGDSVEAIIGHDPDSVAVLADIPEAGTDTSGTGFLSSGGRIGGNVVVAGNLTSTNITGDRAVITSGAQIFNESATTSTELGYVSGVTSAIQTQLDTKQARAAMGDSTKAIALKLDSLNLKGATLPHRILSGEEFHSDPNFNTSVQDSIDVYAREDSLGTLTFPSLVAYHPDTCSQTQDIDIRSIVLEVPVGVVGVDSIVVDAKTTVNHIDSNMVKVIIEKFALGSTTFLDSTASLASANTWTHDATLTALTAITRYDKFRIRIQMKSYGVSWKAHIARIVIYWKEAA